MRLRERSEEADVVEAASKDEGDANVPAGAEIRAFTHAVLSGRGVAAARAALVGTLGEDAADDAASIVAFFDGINRVADATGTQLDEQVHVPDELDLAPMAAGRF